MPNHPDLLEAMTSSGHFVDKTFLLFFGAWKHKATGEPMLFAEHYLDCDPEQARAAFERGDYAWLLEHLSDQTHLHFEARYTRSGDVVGLQLNYTGPPDYGVNITPAHIYTGADAKALLGVAQRLA